MLLRFLFPLYETPGDGGGGSGAGNVDSTSEVASPGAASAASGGEGGGYTREQYEALQKRVDSLSWAERYNDPGQVERAVNLDQWLDTDPVGAHEYITSLLRRGGYLKDQAQPASHRGGADALIDPQTGEPLPDILIKETGQRLMSHEQQRKWGQWMMAELRKDIDPIKADRENAERETQAASYVQNAFQNWQLMGEFGDQVLAEMKRDRRLSLEGAYIRVVVPKIGERAAQKALADIRKKAGAGSHNPAGVAASPSDPSKVPFRELLKEEWNRRKIS